MKLTDTELAADHGWLAPPPDVPTGPRAAAVPVPGSGAPVSGTGDGENVAQRGLHGPHGASVAAEGEAPTPSQAKPSLSARSVRFYASLADAMLPPAPAGLPAIYPVPTVTNAQRRRLKRAIESYKDEA